MRFEQIKRMGTEECFYRRMKSKRHLHVVSDNLRIILILIANSLQLYLNIESYLIIKTNKLLFIKLLKNRFYMKQLNKIIAPSTY